VILKLALVLLLSGAGSAPFAFGEDAISDNDEAWVADRQSEDADPANEDPNEFAGSGETESEEASVDDELTDTEGEAELAEPSVDDEPALDGVADEAVDASAVEDDGGSEIRSDEPTAASPVASPAPVKPKLFVDELEQLRKDAESSRGSKESNAIRPRPTSE